MSDPLFVQRDHATHAIVGVFTVPQLGIAEEQLAAGDPAITAFRATLVPFRRPTPREWLERLPADKQAAIAAAGAGNGTILLWLLKAAGSPSIDVTLPETIAGVGALVTAGILTAADQTTLLTP